MRVTVFIEKPPYKPHGRYVVWDNFRSADIFRTLAECQQFAKTVNGAIYIGWLAPTLIGGRNYPPSQAEATKQIGSLKITDHRPDEIKFPKPRH